MNKDTIKNILESNDGLILSSQLNQFNIPRTYLQLMVENGELERVDRGIYITPETFDDEMFRNQLKYSKGIYSHGTALYMHDLTDRSPFSYEMTFPNSYHTDSIKESLIEPYYVKKELVDLGVVEAKTIYGRTVKTYNMERTICDVIRRKNRVGVEMYSDALKRYVQRKDKDLIRLGQYAKIFRIEKSIRQYLEVLL